MPVTNISNAIIEDITRDRGNTFVTINDRSRPGGRDNQDGRERQGGRDNRIRLVVNQRTVILNMNGRPVPPSSLRVGMVISARVSSAMTRSIPPQATAYLIRIVREGRPEMPGPDMTTTGRIWSVNRSSRSFETITGQDFSTLIRFNVPENSRIIDRQGRPMRFSELMIGMRVRVRHASFMTASIPPQTTAFEVQVL